MALVELGGRAVKCSPLNSDQNLICLGIGASSLVIGFLIKLLPESINSLLNKINPFHRDGSPETSTASDSASVLQRPSMLKVRNSVRKSIQAQAQRNSIRNS